ncbi:MAG: D-alanyl-D-alanine carboxypeptidase family protein [Candidatus Saccharibacteria bacterium]
MALRTTETDDPKLNPGQVDSDEKFNGIKKAEEDGTFNDIVNNYDKPADDTKDSDSAKNVRQAEENPAGWNTNVSKGNSAGKKGFDKLKFIKKKGPLAGIILTIVGGAIGAGGLLAPGLAIVHLKEIFSSALSDSTPALSQRTVRMLASKAHGVRDSFAESSDGKCNIKCKFGTMNDAMKRNLEAKNFKVLTDKSNFLGRHVVTEIIFPDGTHAKSGAAFEAALKDPARASSFNKVFNSKTAYFLNSKFGSMLNKKFGLDKLPKMAGETKEKAVKSFRKSLGLEGDNAATDPSLKLPPEEKAKSGLFKDAFSVADGLPVKAVTKLTNAIGMGCLAYTSARDITMSVKAVKMAKFAAFAMTFLVLADQIKSGDSPDPAVVEQAGDMLTQTETNATNTDSSGKVTPNVFYGKSGFDSSGYKMAAYQDNPGALSAQEQVYAAAPVGTLASALGGITAMLVKGGEPAIKTAHGICKTSANIPLNIALACGPEMMTGLLAAGATAGMTAVGALAWCGIKMAAIVVAVGFGIGIALKAVTGAITNNELPKIDENTIGAAAVDGAYTGSAQVLGGASATYGLKAGTSADIKQYVVDTAAIKQQNDAIARYDAQQTPLNVYDQYSFLGSIVSNVDVVSLANSSLASNMGSIISLIPHSFASLIPTSRAADTATAAQRKAALYGGVCNDQGLASVNVDADSFCNPSYVMSSTELNADSNTVIDYMVAKAQINSEDGTPLPGSDYEKYVTNCADRVEPLGETASAIEGDDYDWKVGLKCTEVSEQLSNFRTYQMDFSINQTIDGDPLTPATAPTQTSDPTAVGNTNIDYTDAGADIACVNDKPGATANFQDGYYENSNGTTSLMYGGSPYKVSKVRIRICQVGSGANKPINSQISASVAQMLKDNPQLRIVSGFRDMALQISLWNGHPDRAWVARPGTSNHQMGLALDLGCGGPSTITSGDPCFNWLKTNAAKYGLTNYAPEPWHWSVSGN